MKHVDPNKLPIVLSRRARADLAAASDKEWRAKFHRDHARHKLHVGDSLGHRWAMQDAIKSWIEAKFYYRRAKNV